MLVDNVALRARINWELNAFARIEATEGGQISAATSRVLDEVQRQQDLINQLPPPLQRLVNDPDGVPQHISDFYGLEALQRGQEFQEGYNSLVELIEKSLRGAFTASEQERVHKAAQALGVQFTFDPENWSYSLN
jgi:hypothetical protein